MSPVDAASQGWPAHPVGRIALLDVDPDLASRAAAADAEGMRDRLTAVVYRLPAGPMPLAPSGPDGTRLGYLVLKGLLLCDVLACGRATAELLGPGDLIRPWRREGAGTPAAATSWTAVEPLLLADLGATSRLAGSPILAEALMARSVQRVEAAAIQRSITAHVRVDVRVLAYLWHLADRFGVVVSGAVRVDLPLTHAVLARLVGARRPTVTTALQRLMQLGYLRRESRAFILVGDAGSISELESRSPARDFALPSDGGTHAVTG